MELWLKSHLATSRDCLQKLFCSANEELVAVTGSTTAWSLAEEGR